MEEQDVFKILEIERRLADWSYWMARFEEGEIGWPSTSLLAIVLELGVVIRSGVPRTPFKFEKAEETNCWINRMGQEKPQYSEAIKAYYLRKKGKTVREVSRELKIAAGTLDDRVRCAKKWLARRMLPCF
jgi:hypothetical protein